jgi:hypothetical protein
MPRRSRVETELARRAVAVLGGRFSTELGIDVDAGPDQVECWALGATTGGCGSWPRVLQASTSLWGRLEQLPGWGQVTVSLFLRQLRGVVPHADPPLDACAREAASHLGLLGERREAEDLSMLRRQAQYAGVDLRDLEAALVRLTLVHRRTMPACPGGPSCAVLAR